MDEQRRRRRISNPGSAWARMSAKARVLYSAALVVAIVSIVFTFTTSIGWIRVIAPVAVLVALFAVLKGQPTTTRRH